MSSKIPPKLNAIRKTSQKQYSKWLRYVKMVFLCFILTFIFAGLEEYFTLGRPIQPTTIISWIFLVPIFLSLLAAIILTVYSKPLSYEKRIFLRILEAYEWIETFNDVSGSSSQENSNLLEAEKSLKKVSERLLENKGEKNTYDLIQEATNNYAKIGELLETRILFYLRNKKELPLIQQKILVLANAFAEANSSNLDFCIKRIEEIPQSGEFKPKPSLLKSKPLLRSALIHGGKFVLSFVAVAIIAYVFSVGFSTTMSSLIVEILPSAIALFIFWESKPKWQKS